MMISLKTLLLLTLGLVLVSANPLKESGDSRRLIKSSPSKPAEWLSEPEILNLIKNDQGFIDITDTENFPEDPLPVRSHGAIPTELSYQEIVRKAIENVDLGRIESFIKDFTDFNNRYQDADTGVQSQEWLAQQVSNALEGYPGTYTFSLVNHGKWRQRSIIVRLHGSDAKVSNEVVILGAHQDSINHEGGDYMTTRAPGADDNASGSVTLLEALRAIVANKIVPRRTVEFQWYAAEERGLLGSKEIAESYYNNKVNVTGMINYDVVGYYVDGEDDVAIITDYVDGPLTDFLRLLVTEYLDFGMRERECGYMCSDHASFNLYGFPVARPSQAVRNPLMHTLRDTIETLSFVQIREFVKIAIGFLVELAEPTIE